MNTMDIPNYGMVAICPYDKNHVILVERFSNHLLRCRRQHPNAKKVICPINSAHHVPEPELSLHTKNCAAVESFKHPSSTNQISPAQTSMSVGAVDSSVEAESRPREDVPSNEENWDDMDEPPYNPETYCLNNPIIRKARNLTKAQKHRFYEAERARHNSFKK
uniref:CHHC U11-48K-type domain-containing protein n=1 Tax=Anopheles epiroticus TaxID=199890 RepID=A0A182PVA6_9DIPT